MNKENPYWELYLYLLKLCNIDEYHDIRLNNFKNDFIDELTKLSFKHVPELKKAHYLHESQIEDCAQECNEDVWEQFQMIKFIHNRNDEVKIITYNIGINKKEYDRQIAQILEGLPQEFHEIIKEGYWEYYGNNIFKRTFVDEVFEKIKKLFFQYFKEDIMKLDENYNRYFENELIFQAHCFMENIYSLNEDD